jgi:hypothetical protein
MSAGLLKEAEETSLVFADLADINLVVPGLEVIVDEFRRGVPGPGRKLWLEPPFPRS